MPQGSVPHKLSTRCASLALAALWRSVVASFQAGVMKQVSGVVVIVVVEHQWRPFRLTPALAKPATKISQEMTRQGSGGRLSRDRAFRDGRSGRRCQVLRALGPKYCGFV